MGSGGKKRTTAAKLNREGRLREKRADKEARKAARKLNTTGDPVAFEPDREEPTSEDESAEGLNDTEAAAEPLGA